MRLLQLKADGQISLANDLGKHIPPYAILSHTWGNVKEEVSLKDLVEGSERAVLSPGYRKIRFCGEQAARDGLRYFWVDTCCIDKTNAVELQEAINSMFRWYKDARKCYVYLQDVSTPDNRFKNSSTLDLDLALRTARWFTRGWTLQELLAPSSVEFFSADWDRIGDKISLERQIHEITRIPFTALRGYNPASIEFSVDERMSWGANRQTTREEDRAYSLFGIFDVFLPLIYGERENAFRRLREEVEKRFKRPDLDNRAKSSVGSRKFSTREAKPEPRCYRCDKKHYLPNCNVSRETVFNARNKRMRSGRCVNCGSIEHLVKECGYRYLV